MFVVRDGAHSILWRRLDAPGHDGCRLEPTVDGWILKGLAAFLDDGQPACLAYRVTSNNEFRSLNGNVSGWIGSQPVDIRVERAPDGAWALNGAVVRGLEECVDIDFGFTPATNVFQLRRIGLRIGAAMEVPVAWLDVAAGTLAYLNQRYERRTDRTYWYEAPRFSYAALLEVGSDGFVLDYPRLWTAEQG